ncbi:translesion DNA synthesis-associated protein ImuA [Thalassotalea sp. PLHSN55]|uniref:translesion DNA synthesis-associated protein ImuA n=1 Tax=Thalassotalea sp. PLHSN55 TaxID=3435888 RepID=UPI003F877C2D
MNNLIEQLQHRHLVWQGRSKAPLATGESTGYAELDQYLDGGFQQGVTEIQSAAGIGELRLLLPMLTRAIEEQRLIVFIAPLGIISAQVLSAQGFDLSKVLLVYPEKQQESLWAAEQCLRSGACHSVIMWTHQALEVHQVKRLQVASETGNSRQFILRTNKAESLSLPFDLSLSLQPHAQGVSASINKRKRGWRTDHFIINMAKHWPRLTQAPLPDNVVQFSKAQAG